MKTSFYLRKTKNDAALMTVCIRVREGQLDLRTVTPLCANPKYWDAKLPGYKPGVPSTVMRTETVRQFNNQLKALLIYIGESVDGETDAASLKSSVVKFFENGCQSLPQEETPMAEKEKPMTLVEAFERYISENTFSPRHLSVTVSLKRRMTRYVSWREDMLGMDDGNIYLEDIDAQTLSDIREYTAREFDYFNEYPEFYAKYNIPKKHIREISPNSLTSYMARTTFVLNWCVKQGYMTNLDYKSYDHGVLVYGSPYYLTLEERDQIYNADMTGWPQMLIDHRDMFMFQCLVGCRHSDLIRLTKDNIVDDFLEYIPQKNLRRGNGSAVRVPLNDKAKELLKRHAGNGDRLFPFHCRQSYNADIKLLLNLLGVRRVVTVLNRKTHLEEQHPIYELASSHLARRTFIGNLYKKVKDQELVASLTGHAPGSKAFARYRSIDDDIKQELIEKID